MGSDSGLILNDVSQQVLKMLSSLSLSFSLAHSPSVSVVLVAPWLTYTYYCITSRSNIIPACVGGSGEMMREPEKKSGKAMPSSFSHNSAHMIRQSRSSARN